MRVLILLWVEYGLGGVEGYRPVYAGGEWVLILLWVEYGLGGALSRQ